MAQPRNSDGKFSSGNTAVDKEEKSESETVKLLRSTVSTLQRKLTKTGVTGNLMVQTIEEIFRERPPEIRLPAMPRKSTRKAREQAVLHVADLHIGKVTSTYNTFVAEERLRLLVEKVISITNTRQNGAACDDLRLYLGGDMIEGEQIFATQAHMIDASLFEQAIKSAPVMLTKMILRLLECFRTVTICTVPGNHGRNGPKGGSANPKTNWDNVVYEVVKLMLLGTDEHPNQLIRDRIEFNISDTFYIVDHIDGGWGNLMVHGHQITGGFGGFPWYGTAKKAWGWIDAIPEHWDYLWFGHFHTYASASLNMRTFLANGTSESDNDYAQASMAACGVPCQRLAFFNEDGGLISDNQVFLGEHVPACRRHS